MKSLYFSFSLVVIVVTYWFIVPKKWRSNFLLLCSLAFISIFNLIYAFYYLIFVSIVYLTALLIFEKKAKKKLSLFSFILVLLIGNLCFYKYFTVTLKGLNLALARLDLLPVIEVPSIAFPLGLSFITFRLIHYIVEVYRGKIYPESFTDFTLYILFFPTFLAGPVERFPKFKKQTVNINANGLKISDINYGLFRILEGIIKKFFIADNLYRIIFPVIQNPQDFSKGALVIAIYISAIWLYMDLSGYTDMAIGLSRLFGYKIIENFNWPYFQKNIALFWRNWHISVYSWIRDYFYFPLFVYRGSKIKLYLGTFCTIMIFMLWHQASWGFLFAGLYHGIGLVAWRFFQELKQRYHFLSKLFNHRWLDPLSIVFTFSFVAFGVSIPFFAKNLAQIKIIISKLLEI
jgi:alginate O-acetyltransferase complex protein AlgI